MDMSRDMWCNNFTNISFAWWTIWQPVATPVKQTEVPGLPSYGSIAAFPPPPPYSAVDSQVNVPPASPPVYQTEAATEATPTGR